MMDLTETQTNFVSWLRNTHAMEQQALTMLNAQVERLETYPQLRARIAQHIQETERQAQQVQVLLDRYGSNTSMMKDMTAKVMASAQALGGSFVGDEVVKGAQMGYVFENIEIASYTILISAARSLGDHEAVRVLEPILQEEIAMADWMLRNLPDVTQSYLARVDAGVQAKR